MLYVNSNYTVRNGSLASKHIFAGNTRVCSKVALSGADESLYYYHGDHLGSSSVITDKAGGYYESLEYFPYGETWVQEKVSASLSEQGLPYKFTGKEQDPETGLYYFGARYYDAVISRWISSDPAIIEYLPFKKKQSEGDLHSGGVYNSKNLSLFSYAFSNPIILFDPDGKKVYLVVVYTRAGVGLHSYLKLVPDKPSDFATKDYNDIKLPKDQITKENQGAMKNKPFTSLISGFGKTSKGEESAFNSSRLVVEANWSGDVGNSSDDILKQIEITPQDGMTDTDFIKKIVDNYREYRDKPFDQKNEYELTPDKDDNEGNCNSMSHGLLKASGAKNIPTIGEVEKGTGLRGEAKGWKTPVEFGGKSK